MSLRAERLHASPWSGVFYVAGGGSLLLSELLTTAGASATVLDAQVPYAAGALAEVLGRAPEQACSDSTARAMAMAAFQRARSLGAARPFGLACTASLATTRKKRGEQRAHVALQTEEMTYSAHLAFEGAREEQERQLLELLWHALSEVLGLNLETLPPARPMVARTSAQQHWRQLILGEELAFSTREHDGTLLMPGAFNPLHHAHERMLAIAERRTGLTGAFELSIVNVDKPLLDYTEIDLRLKQFRAPVWFTRLPTFVEKARHFRGAHFVVGVDTLIRIVDPDYYGSVDARDRALAELADLGARFVVFGRALTDQFLSLSDVRLPRGFDALCLEVSKAEFHETVSSTALRLRATPPQP
jgi:nicotinamide mononucleotide (NMN) deamidase PncC